jgi:hypothetical protein
MTSSRSVTPRAHRSRGENVSGPSNAKPARVSSSHPRRSPSRSTQDVFHAPSVRSVETPATALIRPTDVVSYTAGGAVDVMSVQWTTSRGELVTAFERLAPDDSRSVLQLAIQKTPGSTPRLLGSIPTDSTHVGAPSFVRAGAKSYLYYFEASSLFDSKPRGLRREILGNTLGSAESVPDLPGVDFLASWPRIINTPRGVMVALRNRVSAPQVDVSDDGLHFIQGPVLANTGAMAAPGAFANGDLAFGYQTGAMPMLSYVRIFTGDRWSAPLLLSDKSQNIHDASFVTRQDGGVDAYYIYPPDDFVGFSLFRRSLRTDGQMGPEERLTDASLGEVSKPNVTRLSDGRLSLTWAEISKRDPNTFEPIEQRLKSAILTQDAPAVV